MNIREHDGDNENPHINVLDLFGEIFKTDLIS